LWIIDDRIATVDRGPTLMPNRTIDAKNRIVTPGWIDMHVHLREPGREEDETIASGAAAAHRRRRHQRGLHAEHRAADRQSGGRRIRYLQAKRAGMANVSRSAA